MPVTHSVDIFRDTFGYDQSIKASEIVQNYNHSPLMDTWLAESIHRVFTPRHQVIDNGFLLPPTSESPRRIHTPYSEHVVYDADWQPVLEANHYSYNYIGFAPNGNLSSFRHDPLVIEDHITGPCYYMGALLTHHGHFFLECLSRYWHALEHPVPDNTTFVFNLWKRDVGDPNALKEKLFQGRWHDFFQVLGIRPDNLILLTRPASFDHLTVPQCAYTISGYDCHISEKLPLVWGYLHERMSAIGCECYDVSLSADKIYISRRHVSGPAQDRHIRNEEDVENLFASYGFRIVVPEALDSQYEMQAIISKCKVIASSPGSGLQNSAFARPGTKILNIVGENMNKDNAALIHQASIDYIVGNPCFAYYENDLNDDPNDHGSTINLAELRKCIEHVLAA